jgi:protein-disulfide isomerase
MMKGTILFFTLALMLLALGCIKSKETPFKTHAPPVVTSSPKTPSLQMNDIAKIKEFFEVKCSLCHSLSRISSTRKNMMIGT